MKLTTSQLKKIIKEELQKFQEESENLYENNIEITDEDVKTGAELVNSPVGNLIFKALDDDPKVQQALQQAQAKMTTQQEATEREFGDVGGQYAVAGGALGLGAVAQSAQMAFWTGVLTKSLGPAAAGVLTALGIGTGGIAAGALVGYLIYRGLIKPKGQ